MKNLVILLLLFGTSLQGQNTFNVQSNFGNLAVDLRSIVATDSCYYVTGVFLDSANLKGTIFIKFDQTGDTLLTNKLVSPFKTYESWFGDMLQTEDGGLLEIGQVTDSIEKAGVYKFNTVGDTLFTRVYLSPYLSNEFFSPYEIVKMENGKYAILNVVAMPGPNNELLLNFMDDDLKVQAFKLYGTSMHELAGTMIATSDGGLIIGASRANTNTNIQNFTSKSYIFKVDSLGNVVWEYLSPNGQLQDRVRSMVNTTDGGLVVASGKGIEHSVNPSISIIDWHGYIFKLNANHQFVWGRQFRGTRPTPGTFLRKILLASDAGGFVACGTIAENKSDGMERFGTCVVKVSNQGDSLWARYYTIFEGMDRTPDPFDMKATHDGGYIIAGQTSGNSQNTGWLMKLDSFGCLIPGCNANDGPNATAEAQDEMKLAIYPNPTADFLNFELRSPRLPQSASFRIVDAMGRVVKELQSDSPRDTFIVPVREWASGVYWLQYLEGGEVRASEQFVVNK
jgi:Secretion system C-terminal sorting domain